MQYMIGNLAIFNIFAQGVPFLFQAGQKRKKSSAGLEKVNTFSQNFDFQKPLFYCFS